MGFLSGIFKAAAPIVGGILGGPGGAAIGAGLAGGLDSADASAAARRNEDMQTMFARNGIRWKVEDAKAAGIHPLYALGAQTHSFNPVSVGDNSASYAQMGQDISRSINATRTHGERANAVVEALSVERAQLENDLLRSQIRKINQVGPAMPSPTDTPIVPGAGGAFGPTKLSPTELVATDPGQPFKEAGAVSEMTWARTPGGGVAPVPSQDWKNRGEDQFGPELGWMMRNTLAPMFSSKYPKPPLSLLPAGYDRWVWSPLTMQFVPARSKAAWKRKLFNE